MYTKSPYVVKVRDGEVPSVQKYTAHIVDPGSTYKAPPSLAEFATTSIDLRDGIETIVREPFVIFVPELEIDKTILPATSVPEVSAPSLCVIEVPPTPSYPSRCPVKNENGFVVPG
jgi:hypothetical protein